MSTVVKRASLAVADGHGRSIDRVGSDQADLADEFGRRRRYPGVLEDTRISRKSHQGLRLIKTAVEGGLELGPCCLTLSFGGRSVWLGRVCTTREERGDWPYSVVLL